MGHNTFIFLDVKSMFFVLTPNARNRMSESKIQCWYLFVTLGLALLIVSLEIGLAFPSFNVAHDDFFGNNA